MPYPLGKCLAEGFFGYSLKILALIAYTQKPPINAHVDISSRARGLNFGLSLHLHPYFVFAISEGCGEGADLPKHWLLNIAISTKISYAGPYTFLCYSLKNGKQHWHSRTCWVILSSADLFSKSTFSKNSIRNTIRGSNKLEPDQTLHSGLCCLCQVSVRQ